MSLNGRLKIIREVAGLTQSAAAAILGVHRVTLARMESEGYPVSEDFLGQAKIAFETRIHERVSAIVGKEVALVA